MEGSSNFARGMEVMSSFFSPEWGEMVGRFFSPKWGEVMGSYFSPEWVELVDRFFSPELGDVVGTFSYWVWREVVGDRFSSMGHGLAENSFNTPSSGPVGPPHEKVTTQARLLSGRCRVQALSAWHSLVTGFPWNRGG